MVWVLGSERTALAVCGAFDCQDKEGRGAIIKEVSAKSRL